MEQAKVFLLTGLSGAGKTTLAQAMASEFGEKGKCVVLDGDAIRKGVNRDLGFSRADRAENARRCAELAKLLSQQGLTVILALIAPYEELRKNFQELIGKDNFRVIHISCPLEECMRRDPKKNYRKALDGEMKNYTGIGDVYEKPVKPHLTLETDKESVDQCAKRLRAYMLAETDQLGKQ